MPFLLGLDTQPMEAKTAASLPDGPDWQFEPKWDGFRCLAFKSDGDVELRAKSGKSLSRYFPEMIAALSQARADDFVLDGELAVPRGETLSFGALQDRVHPAESRVRKLAAETPALLILFDCLAAKHAGSLLAASMPQRRLALGVVAMEVVPPGLTGEGVVATPTLLPEEPRMDVHENARTTRHSRMLMIDRLHAGWTVVARQGAAAMHPRADRRGTAAGRARHGDHVPGLSLISRNHARQPRPPCSG